MIVNYLYTLLLLTHSPLTQRGSEGVVFGVVLVVKDGKRKCRLRKKTPLGNCGQAQLYAHPHYLGKEIVLAEGKMHVALRWDSDLNVGSLCTGDEYIDFVLLKESDEHKNSSGKI